MQTKSEWIDALEELVALRGKKGYHKRHAELSRFAARVDFVFLSHVLSGQLEQAKRWMRDADGAKFNSDNHSWSFGPLNFDMRNDKS